MSLTADEARRWGWVGLSAIEAVMAPPSALPLDAVTGALAAYSVARKLRAGYSGSAIRIRRSSDNAEQDIGFDGNGDLDTAAITTFVGGNSAYVKTIYDQTTNGLNLTQSTTGSQPRIVGAGVLDTLNERPAALFDGTDDILLSGAAGSTASAFSLVMVAQMVSAAGEDLPFGIGVSGSSFRNRLLYRPSTGDLVSFATWSRDVSSVATTWGTGGAAHVFAATQSGTGVVFAKDGVTETAVLPGSPSALLNTHPIGLGGISGSGSYYTAMRFVEGFAYASQLVAGDRKSLEDSAAWYYGTPATPNGLSRRGVKQL